MTAAHSKSAFMPKPDGADALRGRIRIGLAIHNQSVEKLMGSDGPLDPDLVEKLKEAGAFYLAMAEEVDEACSDWYSAR